MSIGGFISAVMSDQETQIDEINFFADMPDSMNVCLRDTDGILRVYDISSAIALYSDGTHAWKFDIDGSGSLSELDDELGFDATSFMGQYEQCLRIYVESLSEANSAASHLYTYSKRLDIAHTWATAIPESVKTQTGEAVIKELRTYLTGLGNGLALNETLKKYGKAMVKVKKLKSMLEKLSKLSTIIANSGNSGESETNVAITTVTLGNSTVSGLVSATTKKLPDCVNCKERVGNYVITPCGHLFCSICLPLEGSHCHQCQEKIVNRQRINLLSE